MKKMFLRSFLVLSCCLFSVFSWSQGKHVSASLRYGFKSIGAVATVPAGNKAEVMGMYTSFHSRERKMVTLLYVQHFLIPKVSGLTWFAGAGVHGGLYASGLKSSSRNVEILVSKRKFIAGASGIIGISYPVRNTPIFLSADLKPYVDFVNGESGISDAAIGVGLSF